MILITETDVMGNDEAVCEARTTVFRDLKIVKLKKSHGLDSIKVKYNVLYSEICCQHRTRSFFTQFHFLLKATLDPWKSLICLTISFPTYDSKTLCPISSHLLGLGFFHYPLSLSFMTSVLVTCLYRVSQKGT